MEPERVDHSTTNDITDAELIALLRKRLHDLEEAAENYIEVVTETGERRMAAMAQLQSALSSDFKTAILTSYDMTDEQRSYWLSEIAKGATAESTAATQDQPQ